MKYAYNTQEIRDNSNIFYIIFYDNDIIKLRITSICFLLSGKHM